MSLNPVTPFQFVAFRIILGAYLFIHFVSLIGYAPEMFSREGLIPVGSMNPTSAIFPNILNVFDSPLFTQAFVSGLAVLSLLLISGWKRPWVALFLWYGWACLFNRNIFTGNPGLPFIGWVLLALALIPKGEPWAFKEKDNPDWAFPKEIFFGAWFLLAAGYSISGLHKLGAPSWVNGEALFHVLNNPLARDTFIREWLIAAPGLLKLMTWGTLALEILFAPLALFAKIRPWPWLAMVGMHLGIMCTLDFADLTAGLLMIHFFTFDSRWLKPKVKDPDNPPVVFFDGVCGLCDRYVDFVMREDQAHVYKVSPLQGETARQRLDPDLVKDLNTIVLLEDNKTWFKSSAVLRTLKGMGGFWALFYVFIFIPEAIRNLVYDLVARYRYNVFGKSETCRLPTPEERELFLD